jgi:hypothetical protein
MFRIQPAEKNHSNRVSLISRAVRPKFRLESSKKPTKSALKNSSRVEYKPSTVSYKYESGCENLVSVIIATEPGENVIIKNNVRYKKA